MKNVIEFGKKLFAKLHGLFPTALPIGVKEFESWSDSIIYAYSNAGWPNRDSIQWVLATLIMHLDKAESKRSKYYFARSIHKAASNQVAAQFIQDLKTKQQDAQKAAQDNVQQTAVI